MPEHLNRSKNSSLKHSSSYLFFAYYAAIALFLLGWGLPQMRVWGFNWFAYQPTIFQIFLIITALLAPSLLWMWRTKISNSEYLSNGSSNQYSVIVLISSAGFALLFYLFYSTTHFLGDGYELINRLAENAKHLKSWDIGASLLNEFVMNSLGEFSEENALLTFRIITFGSGLFMLLVTSIASYKLFNKLSDRILFFFGLASSGYMLHFFGYVENYALFNAMIISFTLIGMLAALGKISRWLCIIPVILACGLHIFGVTLIPPLLYILFFDKKPLVQFDKINKKYRVILFITFILIAVTAYFVLFYNYYFFRFAFLPLIPDRFTVDDDYLLSVKHATDLFNLLILLVPGSIIFLTDIIINRKEGRWHGIEMRFLLILLASTTACIYLFNPGHGMPRNWDLFSIPGIPLAVLIFYYFITNRSSTEHKFISTILSITLGFLLLFPRVSSQHNPDIAINHFKNYVELDRTRNRNSRTLLSAYYKSMGNNEAAASWEKLTIASFPEAGLTTRGKKMLQSGQFDQAEQLFLEALEINPISIDAYSNLGTCYLFGGQLDKAQEYLEIADGLNPLNASIINNRGTVYLKQGELDHAKDKFEETLRIDKNNISAIAGLISVNVQKSDDQQTSLYLEMLRNTTELPVDYFKQGAEVCAQSDLINSTKIAFDLAVKLGAGIEWQQEFMKKYPSYIK